MAIRNFRRLDSARIDTLADLETFVAIVRARVDRDASEIMFADTLRLALEEETLSDGSTVYDLMQD